MTEKSLYNWKGKKLEKHFSGTCKQLAEEKGGGLPSISRKLKKVSWFWEKMS